KQQYREWLADRPVEKRDCPFWWDDPRRGAPTRPVVGITWFEAVAYTRWLEEQLNVEDLKLKVWQAGQLSTLPVAPSTLNARLPSEAEWEKAARGPEGLKYAWGKDWQDDCANVKSMDLGQTTPVGMFPHGASPYGVLEMSGNVWEWTRSRWGERSVMQPDYIYPYAPGDGRERLEGIKIPVLRGASWYNDERAARCAVRGRYGPISFNDDYGFRVVVSLVGSDF
ncbi:MAG: SUMF1/EgtB/PvdO family nonheme iron enzyme, partial [Anaerolineae bacterium]|nr:SUMF1/EgtB/PvdO family nonheme iron enzyme [Anaerolineae bacterium]